MLKPRTVRSLPGRIAIGAIVLTCLALGLIGLVLPVIPGLVFLALAALVLARHVPWVDSRLRVHRAFGPHMHRVDRFFDLGFFDKARVAGLVCLKGALDGLERVSKAVERRL